MLQTRLGTRLSTRIGGGRKFSLADFNPALLLESDSGVTVESGGISTWQSQDAGGKVATQATAAARPTLIENVLNGHPVVRFDGVDDRMVVDFAVTLAQPITTTVVARVTAGGVYILDGVTPTDRQIIRKRSGIWNMYAGANLNSSIAFDAEWHILTAAFNGAASQLYIDGMLVAEGNAGSMGLSGLTLGSQYSGATPTSEDIVVGFVTDRLLEGSEVSKTHQYLSKKYGIALA